VKTPARGDTQEMRDQDMLAQMNMAAALQNKRAKQHVNVQLIPGDLDA